MKTLSRFAYLFAGCLALGWFSAGCDKTQLEDPNADADCRIQRIVSTSPAASGGAQTYTNYTIDYNYDSAGRLIKTTYTGGGNGVITTVDYRYNTDGYLTATHSQSVRNTDSLGVPVPGKALSYTSDADFTYTNGRLTGYTVKSAGTIKPTVVMTGGYVYNRTGDVTQKTARNTYEYDPAVVKERPAYASGLQRTWTYANKQLTDYSEKTEGGETHPYTIQNGLITRVTNPDGYATYAYDDQQRVTKMELYNGTRLNSSYTQEWSSARVANTARPAFKGFPAVLASFVIDPRMGDASFGEADFGQATYVEQAYKYFADYPGYGFVQLTALTNTVQTNARGLITSVTTVNTDQTPSLPSRSSQSTTTYTYTNCD